jgi:hypothetical protein
MAGWEEEREELNPSIMSLFKVTPRGLTEGIEVVGEVEVGGSVDAKACDCSAVVALRRLKLCVMETKVGVPLAHRLPDARLPPPLLQHVAASVRVWEAALSHGS